MIKRRRKKFTVQSQALPELRFTSFLRKKKRCQDEQNKAHESRDHAGQPEVYSCEKMYDIHLLFYLLFRGAIKCILSSEISLLFWKSPLG